jgi:hypothetical protein
MTVQIRTTGAIIQVDWLYKNLYVEHSTNRIFYEHELDFDYLKSLCKIMLSRYWLSDKAI